MRDRSCSNSKQKTNLILLHTATTLIGAVGGATIVTNILFAQNLLNFLKKGLYRPDWIFNDHLVDFLIGVPLGSVIGMIVAMLFVKKRWEVFWQVSLAFAIATVFSHLLIVELNARIRPSPIAMVQNHDIVAVTKAIKKGEYLDVQDINGTTPLIQAIEYEYIEIAKALIEAGADVNASTNNGVTALQFAAGSMKNGPEIVNGLIKAGADVNAKSDFGRTALMVAASKGNADVVKILIKTGANVNAKSNDGSTAFMLAKRNDRNDIMLILLQAGARE